MALEDAARHPQRALLVVHPPLWNSGVFSIFSTVNMAPPIWLAILIEAAF